MAALAAEEGVAVAAIVGTIAPGTEVPYPVVALTDVVGEDNALSDTVASIKTAAYDLLLSLEDS